MGTSFVCKRCGNRWPTYSILAAVRQRAKGCEDCKAEFHPDAPEGWYSVSKPDHKPRTSLA